MSTIDVTEAERPLVDAFVRGLRGSDSPTTAEPRAFAPLTSATAEVLSAIGAQAARGVKAHLAFADAASGSVGAEEAARLLGVGSAQAVYQRAKRFGLLGVEIGGRVVFPVWQFDPDGDRLRPAVADALRIWRAAHVAPVTVLSWFTTPQPDLDGHRPTDLLGDPLAGGRLLMAARYAAAPFAH